MYCVHVCCFDNESLFLSLSQVLFVTLAKAPEYLEDAGVPLACVTFSNPFDQPFELTVQSGFNVSGPAGTFALEYTILKPIGL
jgi:hypothetical protein